jgi:hypothetical protein
LPSHARVDATCSIQPHFQGRSAGATVAVSRQGKGQHAQSPPTRSPAPRPPARPPTCPPVARFQVPIAAALIRPSARPPGRPPARPLARSSNPLSGMPDGHQSRGAAGEREACRRPGLLNDGRPSGPTTRAVRPEFGGEVGNCLPAVPLSALSFRRGGLEPEVRSQKDAAAVEGPTADAGASAVPATAQSKAQPRSRRQLTPETPRCSRWRGPPCRTSSLEACL